MAYEPKPNTGSIFRNEKKAKDTHPDYRGLVNVDGTKWEISLWIKESKDKYEKDAKGNIVKDSDGEPKKMRYLNAQFKPPYQKEEPF